MEKLTGLIISALTVFQVCIEVTDYLVCKPCCGKRRKLELNLATFTETEVIAWFNLSDARLFSRTVPRGDLVLWND